MRACPEYRDLLTHVPRVLEAVGDLGLGSSHRVADIHRVLQADACATCGDRGPLLFLPTCERCCEACVEFYPSLRLMRPSQAGRYYGLSKEQCLKLHAVHLPPRKVRALKEATGLCLHTLYPIAVSAKAARDLALAVYGSEEALAQAVSHNSGGKMSSVKGKYWHEAHRVSPRHDWRQLSPQDYFDNFLLPPETLDSVKLAQASTMLFPTLAKRPTATLETLMWCRGCESTKHLLVHRAMEVHQAQDDWKAMVPPEFRGDEYRPLGVALGMAKRAWSRDSFLGHVRRCPGAQRFIAENAS